MNAIGALIRSGAVRLVELDEDALHWIVALLDQYASLGAQMADAGLIHLAEQEEINTVFTLDRGDFSIYWTSDSRAFEDHPGTLIVDLGGWQRLRGKREPAPSSPRKSPMGSAGRARLETGWAETVGGGPETFQVRIRSRTRGGGC